jgi:hypothetical protein
MCLSWLLLHFLQAETLTNSPPKLPARNPSLPRSFCFKKERQNTWNPLKNQSVKPDDLRTQIMSSSLITTANRLCTRSSATILRNWSLERNTFLTTTNRIHTIPRTLQTKENRSRAGGGKRIRKSGISGKRTRKSWLKKQTGHLKGTQQSYRNTHLSKKENDSNDLLLQNNEQTTASTGRILAARGGKIRLSFTILLSLWMKGFRSKKNYTRNKERKRKKTKEIYSRYQEHVKRSVTKLLPKTR